VDYPFYFLPPMRMNKSFQNLFCFVRLGYRSGLRDEEESMGKASGVKFARSTRETAEDEEDWDMM
jgi:hypothetical protein